MQAKVYTFLKNKTKDQNFTQRSCFHQDSLSVHDEMQKQTAVSVKATL